MTLVQLDGTSLPTPMKYNACDTRAFLARLLPQLADACPTIIAVDLAFTDEGCDQDHTSTKALREAVLGAAKHVPLVLAQGTHTYKEATERITQIAGADANQLVPDKGLFDTQHPPENVYVGLTRLNRDPLKAPIVWSVVDPEGTNIRSRTMPAFGFAAASLYRQYFPHGRDRLEDLQRRQYHPYTDFLPSSDFTRVAAMAVLCDDQHARTKAWRMCQPGEGDPQARATIRGRIVVVGWSDHPSDVHAIGVDQVPGYIIHANYIEALLDGRMYRPVGFVIQFVVSFVWFAVLETIFRRHQWPWIAVVATAVGTWITFAVGIFYIAFVNLGWYLNPLVPSVLALIVRSIQVLVDRREQASPFTGQPAPTLTTRLKEPVP